MADITLCTYENRPKNLIGLKLLCLSLNRHNPGLPLKVFSHQFPKAFRLWVDENTRDVELVEFESENAFTWDVKPLVLANMLARGHRRVMWIDTDIIVTRDIQPTVDAVSPGVLGISDEPGTFDERRVTCHGMVPGRKFSRNVNSSLVCVDSEHLPLMERWNALMRKDPFRSSQSIRWEDRAHYLFSDQDVLSGLLCGKEPEGFSTIPVKFFTMNEVITHGEETYRLKPRFLRCLRPLVPFVHASGPKPWNTSDKPHRRLHRLSVELALYNHAARPYAQAFSREELRWTSPQSATAKLLNLLALGNPHLRGALPMLLKDFQSKRSA